MLARKAYKSFIQAYDSHFMKDVFNVHKLDLQDVAASFCFTSPPRVNLHIQSNASKFRNKKRRVGRRHGFSESNPYGRSSDDTRHFTRDHSLENATTRHDALGYAIKGMRIHGRLKEIGVQYFK